MKDLRLFSGRSWLLGMVGVGAGVIGAELDILLEF